MRAVSSCRLKSLIVCMSEKYDKILSRQNCHIQICRLSHSITYILDTDYVPLNFAIQLCFAIRHARNPFVTFLDHNLHPSMGSPRASDTNVTVSASARGFLLRSNCHAVLTPNHLDIRILPHLCSSRNNLARMPHRKSNHHQEHQRPIKDVKINLAFQQRPIISHNVLHDSEERPDEDECTGDIKNHEMFLPWNERGERCRSWNERYAVVEYTSYDEKETEEDDLED